MLTQQMRCALRLGLCPLFSWHTVFLNQGTNQTSHFKYQHPVTQTKGTISSSVALCPKSVLLGELSRTPIIAFPPLSDLHFDHPFQPGTSTLYTQPSQPSTSQPGLCPICRGFASYHCLMPSPRKRICTLPYSTTLPVPWIVAIIPSAGFTPNCPRRTIPKSLRKSAYKRKGSVCQLW